MKTIILGNNRCGKSVYAENFMIKLHKPLAYFATLENVPENEERILAHSARRDKKWDVIESSAVLEEDLLNLKMLFSEGKYVLLDGFSVYVLRYMFVTSLDCAIKNMSINNLYTGLKNILKMPNANWVVVDVNWIVHIGNPPYDFADIIKKFHNMLQIDCGAKVIKLQQRESQIE